MSYGNGTYVAIDADDIGAETFFDGNKTSIELSIADDIPYDKTVVNMASNQFSSTTGYYNRSTYSTFADGFQYKGFFIELSMPVAIYLTDVYLYRQRKKTQPLNVVIVGSKNNGEFHLITEATSLQYTISGYEACAKIAVQITDAYDRFRVIITRIGYIQEDGVLDILNRANLAQIEFYGKQEL